MYPRGPARPAGLAGRTIAWDRFPLGRASFRSHCIATVQFAVSISDLIRAVLGKLRAFGCAVQVSLVLADGIPQKEIF